MAAPAGICSAVVSRSGRSSSAVSSYRAELFNANVVVDQLADLGQRHTQIAQDQDAVQPEDLAGRVMPIAGKPIHVGRLEQTKVVVVPQRAYRHLRQARHRAYAVPGSYSTS
jgi:hypothetical protein